MKNTIAAIVGFASFFISFHPFNMARADGPPASVQEVIAEATRKQSDPNGRPLPLASSWSSGVGTWGLTGYPKYEPRPRKPGHLDLQKQRELLLAGHHWLPVAHFPMRFRTRAQDPEGSAWYNFAGTFEPWDTFAKWGVPITFAATQFDAPLYNQSGTTDRWVKLPPSRNPNVIRDGIHVMGTLGPDAVSAVAGTKTVTVSLPGVTGLPDDMRIWFSQDITVGGLRLDGERWDILTIDPIEDEEPGLEPVKGSVITFAHKEVATETEAAGNVTYEVAHIFSEADPMGPIQPWYEVGQWWMRDFRADSWEDLWQRYPQPPRIIFLSNNEGRLPGADKRNRSKRYVDAHGEDTDYAFGARVVKRGYAERFRRLFQGMRDAMPDAWANASTMVAYNAVFTWDYGRWGGWRGGAVGDDLRLDYETASWEGASPEYYLNPWQSCTDHTVFSPQVEFMNVKWQLDLVYQEHPEFWYEMSVWDGFPKKRDWFANNDDPFTPERYKTWLQYGMWLTRPRVVREFRYQSTLEQTGIAYFEAFLAAVDDVYADPVKQRFWRKGTVVPNTSRPHPYRTATLKRYDDIPKWFNLNTDIDPPGSWELTTEIPVWALALVIGEAPHREWLIYCYSPKQDRTDVTITVPGYGDMVVDVPQSGAFYYRAEKTDNE